MNTIILMSAGLVIAFTVGLLVGTGYTTHAVDHSLRLLAQRRRLLNEREEAFESALADHYVCLGRGGRVDTATTNVSSRP